MRREVELDVLKEALQIAVAEDRSAEEVLQRMTLLVDFIFEQFQEDETGNSAEYFSRKFELHLTRIVHFLLWVCDRGINPKYSKSKAIREYILSLAFDAKYNNARLEFIRAIGINWPKEFVQLALEMKPWQDEMYKLEFLAGLNQKRIGGFEREAEAALKDAESPKSELAKIAQRYLKNSPKFKHYQEKFKDLEPLRN